ncbi:hypothetical protein BUALT_BualtUnG0024200 [Buddleja alternifolia]|uniref:BTB/POZ domain-containing protein n=1 Tax=Buddleja alternifolia TaxID=168488 RepID=A0AAV6W3Y3_9LAMI|nr:hypothetical protein BUALT_BualtUnG0024200 [Buddleja alternifolia]
MADNASKCSPPQTMRVSVKSNYTYIVKNYSSCKTIGVSMVKESSEFQVGGRRWTIRFYPNGSTIDAYNDGYASLFISLQSESSTPVSCLFNLYLLDQSGRGNHHGYTMFDGDPPKKPIHIDRSRMSGFLRFIKWASLEHSKFHKDDCLQISCTIEVQISDMNQLPPNVAPNENWKDLGRLLETKQNVDIFCKVGGERFCAHKWVLAARSLFFRSRLSDGHPDKEIVIPDMEPRTFKAMLWYIYTGTLPEEEQDAVYYTSPFIFESFMGKMLAAANRIELNELKGICESRMLERVSVESVPYLLHLADFCHAAELKAACLRFIAENQVGMNLNIHLTPIYLKF